MNSHHAIPAAMAPKIAVSVSIFSQSPSTGCVGVIIRLEYVK